MLQKIETLLKAAADETRLRILTLLGDKPLCVCQLVEVLGLSQSTISKHLFLFKHAGLVENEQRGKTGRSAGRCRPRQGRPSTRDETRRLLPAPSPGEPAAAPGSAASMRQGAVHEF